MSTFIFQEISKRGKVVGITTKGVQTARNWFRNKARRVQNIDRDELHSSNKSRLFTRIGPEDIGSMLMFFYEAKWKDKLPYWDRYPLIFVIETYEDSFLGINLHYLPPMIRAKLMDALYKTAITNDKNKIERLKINYQILASAARFKAFKPCVKKYLKTHLRSRFFFVEPREWDMALMLRVAQFQKATEQTVWRHSKKIIEGR